MGRIVSNSPGFKENTQIMVNRDNCEPAIFDVKNTTPKSKRENVRTAMKSNNLLRLDHLTSTEYRPNMLPTPSGEQMSSEKDEGNASKHKKSMLTTFNRKDAQQTQGSIATATTPTIMKESISSPNRFLASKVTENERSPNSGARNIVFERYSKSPI